MSTALQDLAASSRARSLLFQDSGLAEVEQAMHRVAAGRFLERAGVMVQEHLQAGGKRVRARMALAAAEALGQSRASAIPWAAAVETLHNATLVHDDIQDGDVLRRGEPTLWVRHGLPQALNAGDLMLMMPMLLVAELQAPEAVRWHLALAIAARSAATVRGQAQELALGPSMKIDWRSWYAAAEGKTGQLLALPVEGAALLAGRSPEIARALGDELIHIGVMFQLQDDVRDLYGDKGRGPVGSDLREGRASALVVAHVERHPEDREWIQELLATKSRGVTAEGIELVSDRFRSRGALETVLQRIEVECEAVRTSAVLRSEPRLHELVLELSEWISTRAMRNDGAP
jgi:geranylgeranyl diphosphate synthase type I